jgi:hypothetical protein
MDRQMNNLNTAKAPYIKHNSPEVKEVVYFHYHYASWTNTYPTDYRIVVGIISYWRNPILEDIRLHTVNRFRNLLIWGDIFLLGHMDTNYDFVGLLPANILVAELLALCSCTAMVGSNSKINSNEPQVKLIAGHILIMEH